VSGNLNLIAVEDPLSRYEVLEPLLAGARYMNMLLDGAKHSGKLFNGTRGGISAHSSLDGPQAATLGR
jgi:hypothetical protein